MTQEQREQAAILVEYVLNDEAWHLTKEKEAALITAISVLRGQGWVRASEANYMPCPVCGESLEVEIDDWSFGWRCQICGYEKAKACEYCSDTDDQANLFEENNYEPYNGMESTININKQPDGRHFICADLWGGSNCVADFEIFYCPMCGRKLE